MRCGQHIAVAVFVLVGVIVIVIVLLVMIVIVPFVPMGRWTVVGEPYFGQTTVTGASKLNFTQCTLQGRAAIGQRLLPSGVAGSALEAGQIGLRHLDLDQYPAAVDADAGMGPTVLVCAEAANGCRPIQSLVGPSRADAGNDQGQSNSKLERVHPFIHFHVSDVILLQFSIAREREYGVKTVRGSVRQQGTVVMDSVGAVASTACAVHCAALPLLMAFVPSMQLALRSVGHEWHGLLRWLLWSHEMEAAFALSVIAFASVVLGLSYWQHRRPLPLMVAAGAALMLLVGAFGHWHVNSVLHVLLQVTGGCGIAAAHLLNMRVQRSQCSNSPSAPERSVLA